MNIQIYDYDDYRSYLRSWLREQPKAGRGILRAWADEFRVHPTLLSQILAGKRALNIDLGELIAERLNLSEREMDYLFLLILHEQAGTQRLKNRLQRKIEDARERSQKIAERVVPDAVISEEAKAMFYSSWFYSGIRNLATIAQFQNADALAARLQLPRDVVQSAVEFLVECGLCKLESGRLQGGPRLTFVEAGSPFVARHHQNWRLHAMNKMAQHRARDLFLTFPMSLSESDADRLRSLLPMWFDEVNRIVKPSPSETVRCLNIDYFEY